MSSYDEIKVGKKRGQVKLWENAMLTYEKGDDVPLIPGENPNFSIAMREGGYINIKNGKVQNWTKNPKFPDNIFDKWGASFEPNESHGMLGEPYFFDQIQKEGKDG